MKKIILLHGAIGAKDQLLFLSEALQQKGFEPYLFSFSGHGKMPFQSEFGIAQFANELAAFIAEKKLQGAAVFGYSMGGYVALYLAAQKPNLIGKIATLATKFDWTVEGATKEAGMLNPNTILEKVPQFATDLKQRHGEEWKQLLAQTALMMQEMAAQQLLNKEVLRSITCPVLLGIGDSDKMVSMNETRTIFETLPVANMYVLPKTKHPIEGVNVALLASVLEDYFNRI
ncbi:MAG: alpha/beta hydrolase [Chitinophagaceae bacterium]|nr:alpha/beta hydrolase [Chitinophagaceae bacterium]